MRQPDYARSGGADGRRFAWPSPIRLANLLLVAAAAGYFLVRGPARALSQGSRDFITVFAATRAWLRGLDPYVVENQFRSATEALKSFPSDQFLTTPFLHIPASLPLFAPFAALPWRVAESTWIVMNLAAALWTIQKIARSTKSDGLLLWAFLLAFAPLHTGLTVGQPVVAACALIVASVAGSGGAAAGVALGLAGALKPQLAAAFFLVCLARREGRKLTVAASILLILGAIGIARMPPGGLGNMLASISSMSGVTGVANGSGLEPVAYQMINVEILAPSLTSTAFGALMLYAGVMALSAWAIFRVANTSLCLAVAASASILLRYHRF